MTYEIRWKINPKNPFQFIQETSLDDVRRTILELKEENEDYYLIFHVKDADGNYVQENELFPEVN